MRIIRIPALLAFGVIGGILAACSSTQTGGPSDSMESSPDTRTIRVQFQAPWFKDGQLCTFDAGQSVPNGPFNDGQKMTLEDESGTLLARGNIRAVGKVDPDTCAMDALFEDVPSGASNYVVVSTIGSRWRFLESEVEANPVVVDFLKNPGS